MPGAVTSDDYLVQLAQLTTLTAEQWADFLSLSPDDQALAAQGYAACSWVQEPNRFAQVLAILEVVGTIAGVVSGVAGAGSAIVALKAVL
jgi:hypothetical protein